MVFINIALEFFNKLTLSNAIFSTIVLFVLSVVAAVLSQKIVETPLAACFSRKGSKG